MLASIAQCDDDFAARALCLQIAQRPPGTFEDCVLLDRRETGSRNRVNGTPQAVLADNGGNVAIESLQP